MNVSPELINAASNGDRKAQYVLYRQCYPILMAVCVRYKHDEQECVSALNNAFLKIINNLEKYPREAPFEAWIRRIQINTLIDEFRRDKKYRTQMSMPENLELTAALHADAAWNHADRELDAGYLQRLMLKLPPLTRQVFNMFAVDGFSHAEIGQLLGMSDGTSKWHVNMARTQLKAWIKEIAH